MDSLTQVWPPFGVRIEVATPERSIALLGLTDAHLPLLAHASEESVYGPNTPDHAFPWLFAPDSERARNSAQFRWLNRVNFQPAAWSLDLVVFDGDTLIGAVDLRATDFAFRRTVATGSWIFHRFQGQGFGTLVRHAIAGFCFDHLGAERVESGWILGNDASARVSAKLGYVKVKNIQVPAGPDSIPLPGELAELTRERYRQIHPDAPTVTVSGLTPELRAMMGVEA